MDMFGSIDTDNIFFWLYVAPRINPGMLSVILAVSKMKSLDTKETEGRQPEPWIPALMEGVALYQLAGAFQDSEMKGQLQRTAVEHLNRTVRSLER